MRDFSKISPAVWGSIKFKSLKSNEAKILYLYVLTGPHQTNAGVSKVPAAYVVYDLGWSVDQINKLFCELEDAGLIEFDFNTDELWITNWFRHNVPMNKKHRIGIVHTLERVESEYLFGVAYEALEDVYFDCEQEKPNPRPAIDPDTGEILEEPNPPKPEKPKRPNELSHQEIARLYGEKREALQRSSRNQIDGVTAALKVVSNA